MFDVIPAPIVCSTDVLVFRCVGFGFGVEVSGAALGMGGGVVGVSSFLRSGLLSLLKDALDTLQRYVLLLFYNINFCGLSNARDILVEEQ